MCWRGQPPTHLAQLHGQAAVHLADGGQADRRTPVRGALGAHLPATQQHCVQQLRHLRRQKGRSNQYSQSMDVLRGNSIQSERRWRNSLLSS